MRGCSYSSDLVTRLEQAAKFHQSARIGPVEGRLVRLIRRLAYKGLGQCPQLACVLFGRFQ